MADGSEKFARFIDWLKAHEQPCKVAAALVRQGVDLPQVFAALAVYIEGQSVGEERRTRGKEHAKIVNKAVRSHGLAPEVGRWLQDRAELAHSTNGFSRVHNLDSLAWVHLYLELRTRRRVAMSEMAHLVDGANHALGRIVVCDSVELGRELRRHRQRNKTFLAIVKQDIESKL